MWGGGERICRESYSTFFSLGFLLRFMAVREREREEEEEEARNFQEGPCYRFLFFLGSFMLNFLLLLIFFPVHVTG